MKRSVLWILVLALALTAMAALTFSPLTPFTRTEMAADRANLYGNSVAVTLNRRAAEGWLLKEQIKTDEGTSVTMMFTRQSPWYAPGAPTATAVPTATPAPPTKGPASYVPVPAAPTMAPAARPLLP